MEEGTRCMYQAQNIAIQNEFIEPQLMIEQLNAIDIGNRGDFDQACRILEILSEKSKQRGLNLISMTIYYNYSSFMLAKGNFSVSRSLVQFLITQGTLSGPWVEINGQFLLHQINVREGRNDPMPMLRTADILEEIRLQTTLSPLRTLFEHYSQEILHRFEEG